MPADEMGRWHRSLWRVCNNDKQKSPLLPVGIFFCAGSLLSNVSILDERVVFLHVHVREGFGGIGVG